MPLKGRKPSEVLYSHLGGEARPGRLRWFGHVEPESGASL